MDTKKDIKVSVFLDKEMASFIDENKTYGMRRSDYMRGLVWEKMKRKKTKSTVTTMNDPYLLELSANLIPDDLKQYSELLIEWWPIRKQKGAINSTKVAKRIFDKLRSFPSQDRKQALENAITAGWKDIYEVKKGYKPEEPKNNHPASRVFTAERGFE
jgi:hypothetical protein